MAAPVKNMYDEPPFPYWKWILLLLLLSAFVFTNFKCPVS